MNYKKSSIIVESKQIKEFTEKNKKIPITCTLDNGRIISCYSTGYLMGLLIKDNFKSKDYPLGVVLLYDSTRHQDTINEKVMKEDYLKMIDNFIGYCKANRRVPSYITTIKSRIKVSFELFMYCLSKIITFYDNNKYLPNYCIMDKSVLKNTTPSEPTPSVNNCKNPYKSLPINANKGCDAMGQNNNYYCGVSALQKVLFKFGIKVSQKTLASYAGTTTAGTSHQGLKTAIAYISKKYNVKLTVKEYSFSELGFEKLGKLICKQDTDAITHLYYRLKYGHYEKIKSINTKTGQLEIVNSLGDKCSNGCFCGYIENRSFNVEKQYFNGISQKSIILITKGE